MSHKILSFDVGIKNLAYCLLEYTNIENNKKYNILDWGIIDLSDPEEVDKCNYCIHNKKDNTTKICGKKASYQSKNKDILLCKVHHKKYLKENPDKIKLIKEIKKKKKVKKSLIELNKTMIEKMDEKPHLLDINEVLIENQPSLKNPHMKSIQMMIFSYFVMRGISDKSENKINDIVMLSARNKMNIYKGPPIECDIKDKYRRNKFLAIKYCKYMIGEIEELENKFMEQYSTSKKQDDLADSFLQGVFYLNKKFKLF